MIQMLADPQSSMHLHQQQDPTMRNPLPHSSSSSSSHDKHVLRMGGQADKSSLPSNTPLQARAALWRLIQQRQQQQQQQRQRRRSLCTSLATIPEEQCWDGCERPRSSWSSSSSTSSPRLLQHAQELSGQYLVLNHDNAKSSATATAATTTKTSKKEKMPSLSSRAFCLLAVEWMYEALHRERYAAQEQPLQRSRELEELAHAHAMNMAQSQAVFHSVANLEQLQQLLHSPMVGQNVQRGTSLETLWMESLTRYTVTRNNLLSSHFTECGMAVVVGPYDGRLYLCQLFREM